jgi:hypothetical protein
MLAAHRQEFAAAVERQLGIRDQVAALKIGGEALLALGDPFDRAVQIPRGPGEQRRLRIDRVTRPEIAADIVGDDAQPVGRPAEDHVDPGLGPHRAGSRAGIERDVIARGVICGDGRAGLHRDAGDALAPGLEPRHVRGARKGCLCRGGVAGLGVEANIRFLVPEQRRVDPGGVL